VPRSGFAIDQHRGISGGNHGGAAMPPSRASDFVAHSGNALSFRISGGRTFHYCSSMACRITDDDKRSGHAFPQLILISFELRK
jgi:hypothetical protein